MNVSVKLREWRDDLIEANLPVDVVDSLFSVVEAAERLNALHRDVLGLPVLADRDLDDAELAWHDFRAALSALSEALGGGDDAAMGDVDCDVREYARAALADPVEWPDGDEVGQPTC